MFFKWVLKDSEDFKIEKKTFSANNLDVTLSLNFYFCGPVGEGRDFRQIDRGAHNCFCQCNREENNQK